MVDDRCVVHNFGHGGSGHETSYGSAMMVKSFVNALASTISQRKNSFLPSLQAIDK